MNNKHAKFSVTFEIMTPESSECGDAEERGFVIEDANLRDAVEELYRTRTSQVDGVESIQTDSLPCIRPRWITVTNGTEYITGAHESRALHIPDTVTTASARRIARLCGIPAARFERSERQEYGGDGTDAVLS